MIRKIKNILGIEGVKVELFIPEEVKISHGSLSGQAVFTSQSDQHVENLTVRLIEKYKRGRNESKLINEYLLGSVHLELDMSIAKGESKPIDFELPFNMMLSEMDRLEGHNFFVRGMVRLAKKLKGVNSSYKVELIAKIEGTKLNPVISKEILLVE